jgi:hypothetical protein
MTLAATFVEEPATFAGPNRFVLAQTREELVKMLNGNADTARQQGFAKSTCEYLSIKTLNSVMALCSVEYVRRKSDCTELQRSGAIYILRKGDNGWKIRQTILTDLDKLL